jgi:hypothetical protein
MNRRQKILTIVALAMFSAIIFFHYCDPMFHQGDWRWTRADGVYSGDSHGPVHKGATVWDNGRPLIQDVQMPIFALAVFYAGLFFIPATPARSKSGGSGPSMAD